MRNQYERACKNNFYKKEIGVSAKTECKILAEISALTDQAYEAQLKLEEASKGVKDINDNKTRALTYNEEVLGAMTNLRKPVDELEKIVAKKYWPFPAYSDILYSV